MLNPQNPLARGASRTDAPANESTDSPAPVNGAPEVKPPAARPAKPKNLLAACVVVPDEKSGAQQLILTYIVQRPLLLGAPDPYLMALHERLAALAPALGDIDMLDGINATVGAIGELSDLLNKALQVFSGAPVGVLGTVALNVDEAAAVRTRLERAVEILTQGRAVDISPAPAPAEDLAAIARRRDAEARGRRKSSMTIVGVDKLKGSSDSAADGAK